MKFYTRRRVSPVITIVSLVDILTMVLMFFVYTTTFKTQQQQVKIVLPTVGHSGEATAETSPLILKVTPEGKVLLDEKPIALEDLGDAVKNQVSDKHPLQMMADEKADFGKVMGVLDALKGANVSNVSTLTQQKK